MVESRPYLSTAEKKSDRPYSIKSFDNWATLDEFQKLR